MALIDDFSPPDLSWPGPEGFRRPVREWSGVRPASRPQMRSPKRPGRERDGRQPDANGILEG